MTDTMVKVKPGDRVFIQLPESQPQGTKRAVRELRIENITPYAVGSITLWKMVTGAEELCEISIGAIGQNEIGIFEV